MKTLKFVFPLLVFVFMTCGNIIGQTCQAYLHGTFDRIYVICGLGPISGEVTIHFTYHLNAATGYIENMHFNIPKYEVWNSDTRETYKIIDTGKDNLGILWNFFNNINASNGPGGIQYEIEDGWLNSFLPSVLPSEGSYVEMSFKFIADGQVYRYGAMYQLHLNANNQISVDKYKENIDCPQ